MPVALPDDDQVLLGPPDAPEVGVVARGIASAITPPGGLRPLQVLLVDAMCEALTGVAVDAASVEPIGAEAFAQALARRNLAFRTRIVQMMLLGELVLAPLPQEVAEQVAAFAEALCVDDSMLSVARSFASGSLGLAAIDFERNGYVPDLDTRVASLRTTHVDTDDAWAQVVEDPELAARWEALGELPVDTIGHGVWRFYRSRGFVFPGLPGSAPPLLAQHDWVHVLVDYGTTLEAELEVFAFISRANDDPRAFSLLAMVVALFETGYLAKGAGLFEAAPGHLSHDGVATRVADAMRRGALCHDTRTGAPDIDFLAFDWFAVADVPVAELRAALAIPPVSERARAAGSVGPWEPGSMSPYQLGAGQRMAQAHGVAYDSYGATS